MRPTVLTVHDLLARRATAIQAALAAAKAALGAEDPLVALVAGQHWRLTTTGHRFTVLDVTPDGTKVRVLEGRATRYLPVALLRDAYTAGLLAQEEKY